MTKNKHPNLKPFKPGQSGNPSGAKAHDKEKKKLKALTQKHLTEIAGFVVNGDVDELARIIDDPKTPLIQLWFAQVVARGIKEGDPYQLNAFLDRVVGKVPDKVHTFSAHISQVMVEIKKMSKEELIERSRKNLKILEKETVSEESPEEAHGS
jgi:hypothetical protein